MTETDPFGVPDLLRYAASWRIAVAFVSAIPHSRILETHPGGGQYDCLTVVAGPEDSLTLHIDINRVGSLHVHKAPRIQPSVSSDDLWPEAVRPGGAEAIAHRVLENCGLAGRPSGRSAERLTYQVIAHLLVGRCLDATHWEVRSLFLDTSGMGGGIVTKWRCPDLVVDRLQPEKVWVVLADQQPIAWLYEGWVFRPGGERIDLTRRRSSGASLTELAALVSGRQAESFAKALPDVG
jgi:hypothetical protein